MYNDDLGRLTDMRSYAAEAVQFCQGRSRGDLDTDRQLMLALFKCIEVVGEAANQISESFRVSHPEIDWVGAIAMRHRLVHGYAFIDLDIVWQTCADDLPRLVDMVTVILGPES